METEKNLKPVKNIDDLQKTNQDKNELKVKSKNTLHPYSAILMILIDMAFFGANALSTGLATPAVAALAFILTFIGSYIVQQNISKDPKGTSAAKAFFLGIAAGIPTPIAGTTLGFIILGKAGLRKFRI